jgi:hypothetical protein
MTVIEARVGGARRGVLVFFAAHPTDLVHTAPFYSSDFTGIAMDRLESRWRGATAGFFNGAEGDVTALRETRDAVEVRRLAERFEREVVATAAGAATVQDAAVQVRGRVYDAWDDRKCGGAELAKAPKFGAAALGGAEGDRTVLYGLGWREGVRDRAVDGQGPKLPALDSQLLRDLQLTRVAAPRMHFPRYLPVVMARVGPLAFGALPVEASTALGQRLRARFGANFQVIGLADEYSSYNATESEYLAQDYMGASTIWGPAEGEWFACRLAEVDGKAGEFRVPGGAMAPGPPPHKPGWLWLAQLGIATQRYGAGFIGDARAAPDEELERVLLTESGAPQRHLPYFEWTETVAGKEFDAVARQRVVVEGEDGRVVEDAAEFLKMLVAAPDGRGTRKWAAIWVGPLAGSWPGRYRFRVKGADGVEGRSVWFAVDLKSNARPESVRPEK